jgi:hypothetical protein
MELSAVNDNSTDFLSEKELGYYFSLEELWKHFNVSEWKVTKLAPDTTDSRYFKRH